MRVVSVWNARVGAAAREGGGRSGAQGCAGLRDARARTHRPPCSRSCWRPPPWAPGSTAGSPPAAQRHRPLGSSQRVRGAARAARPHAARRASPPRAPCCPRPAAAAAPPRARAPGTAARSCCCGGGAAPGRPSWCHRRRASSCRWSRAWAPLSGQPGPCCVAMHLVRRQAPRPMRPLRRGWCPGRPMRPRPSPARVQAARGEPASSCVCRGCCPPSPAHSLQQAAWGGAGTCASPPRVRAVDRPGAGAWWSSDWSRDGDGEGDTTTAGRRTLRWQTQCKLRHGHPSRQCSAVSSLPPPAIMALPLPSCHHPS